MSQRRAKKERKEQATEQAKHENTKHRTRQDVILNVVIAVVLLAVIGAGAYAVGSKVAEHRQQAAQTQQGTDGQGEQETQTIKTVAESQGMSVADYLKEYGLSEDTPETMPIGEAYNRMTLENVAKASGQSVEDFKKDSELPEDMPNTTIWSEAQKEMTVRAAIGEEQFNQMKEQYQLGDEVTLDMKWKDFSSILQEKQGQADAGQASTAPDANQSGAPAGE